MRRRVVYIYIYTYTLKENDHANDKNARILMNTTNALLVVVVVVVVVSFLYNMRVSTFW